jgi:hypothetical protein
VDYTGRGKLCHKLVYFVVIGFDRMVVVTPVKCTLQ